MEITGKVVLITGASSGIGLATARLFAQKGAKLALAARSAEKLTQLASEPHCLTGNLPLSASNPSFPPTLNWSLLQGRNVAHQL